MPFTGQPASDVRIIDPLPVEIHADTARPGPNRMLRHPARIVRVRTDLTLHDQAVPSP